MYKSWIGLGFRISYGIAYGISFGFFIEVTPVGQAGLNNKWYNLNTGGDENEKNKTGSTLGAG